MTGSAQTGPTETEMETVREPGISDELVTADHSV